MNFIKNLSSINLNDNLHNISKLNILVIGDIMLDHYIYGNADRISPEAPVPIIKYSSENFTLGGAGNVALNIKKLNSNVTLMGAYGSDKEGKILESLLKKHKIKKIILKRNINTIIKTRLINVNYQITRLDKESTKQSYHSLSFFKNIENIIKKHDLIILSDYDKGILTPYICRKIINCANKINKKVIVDPKGLDFTKYNKSYLITPNLKEFKNIIKKNKDINKLDGFNLKKSLNVDNLIITKGEKGLDLFTKNNNFKYIEGLQVKLPDVVGAGDTFIASISVFIATGYDIFIAANLANICASLVVQKRGTSYIDYLELNFFISKLDKVLNKKLLFNLKKNKLNSQKIVFTNGCFDILHPGHLDLFKTAKKFGDILIVGVNSDISIKKIKGSNRPINDIDFRLQMLKSIKEIDFLIVFDELTPINIIKILKPDIIFKGGDYKKKEIVGYKEVKKYGGKILTSKFLNNYSTTNIINKIKNIK